jgi:hydrogenase/urease accessory protein HupE
VLAIGVHLFSDLTSEHRALVTVRFAGREEQYTLLGPSELRVTSTPGSSWWQFVAWGVEHILTGYDHIAFLLALVLGARRLRDLVVLVTAFTVAHSITLLLSALDVIRLPSQMTETLIAASIVYVAAENLWAKQPHHRWMLTFGFGLVHGLGFSSVLRGLLANQNAVLLPVVSFNIGVELGQLGLLAVVYPCLLWLRSTPDPERAQRRQRQLVVIGSSLILLAGTGWLVERLFHLEFMPL